MITEPPQVQALISELTSATWMLAAVTMLFDTGLAEAIAEPRTVDELAARFDSLPRERIVRCLDVLETRGVVKHEAGRYQLAPGAVPFTQAPRNIDLVGEARSALMQSLAYVDAAKRSAPTRGWHHTDPRLLQAQGDSSAGFAAALAGPLGVALDGLQERFAKPGARFLDVGVGVASLSIAMCRAFPQLHAVGLDVFDVPLSLARENVQRAELAQRITLRQLALEDLRDEEAFDLVWVPSCFMTASTIPPAIARARAALRPGGWLLSPTINSTAPDGAHRRTMALVMETWGTVTESAPMQQIFTDAGFRTVRAMPGPGAIALVAAQR